MYYHFDYRGGPISYQWINQTPLPKIWENMTTAYESGIRQIWIVNVGDLKPMELPLDYFMNLAYDYETWKVPNKTKEFTLQWATREFGAEAAATVEEVISGHLKILGARKAEVVHADTFSISKFDESVRVLKNFEPIVAKAETVYNSLPEHKKAAYYQMVLFPARAALNVYQTQIYAAISLHLAEKGDIKANEYAQKARDAFAKDAVETEYYNTKLSGGKWDGIMRQNHIGYTAWNSPEIRVISETMPEVGEVAKGKESPTPQEAPVSPATNLPQVPKGTYIEQFGHVSINPARFTKNTAVASASWNVISDYGREFDSVKVMPITAAFELGQLSPTLEYSFYIQNPGEYTVNIFLIPTNNQYHTTVIPLAQQLRFSVCLNNGKPTTVSGLPENFDAGAGASWSIGVMDNARVVAVPHGQLEQGLHTLQINAVDPGVVIQKIVIAPPSAKQEVMGFRPPTSHFMGAYFGPPESKMQS